MQKSEPFSQEVYEKARRFATLVMQRFPLLGVTCYPETEDRIVLSLVVCINGLPLDTEIRMASTVLDNPDEPTVKAGIVEGMAKVISNAIGNYRPWGGYDACEIAS